VSVYPKTVLVKDDCLNVLRALTPLPLKKV
jgi:hypothetical protein